MRKVLIVDDESDIRAIVKEFLADDFEVLEASDGEQCLSSLERETPSAILLDLNMPVYDGIEVCRRIRSNPQRRSVPIIMLTGHQDESTVVRAFESGADDYVTKPFRAKELRARVLSKVRGDRKEEPASRVSVGDISLDMDSMEVVVAGQMQRVTTLEFRILKHFVENAGRVVTRQALLSSAWKGVTVSDRTVDTHVVGIRRKLANSSMGIVTIYGAGYRLVRSPSA